MFSPMSSGRDKWDEAGSSGGSRNKISKAGTSPLASINRSFHSASNIVKGKGKSKSLASPSGRILAPVPSGSHSLAFQKNQSISRARADRPPRRNFYATASVDEGRGEIEALLCPTSSSNSKTGARTSGGRRYEDARRNPRWKNAFRPSKKTVDRWMESWFTRWTVLAVVPSVFVWVWCAMPFPTSLAKGTEQHSEPGHVDGQFMFYLVWYYGIYSAVGLIYITQLFSLYRLNWWPAALGARKSYMSFWLLSVATGYALHVLAWDRLPSMGDSWLPGNEGKGGADDDEDKIQWQRKTPWVALAFATMAMPAFVCLAGLRRGGRQTYRHSLTDTQKTFLENELSRRIPASYTRFLWFMAVIGAALIALIAGQGYASVYLSTLPHTGLDGTAYVAFWTVNVNILLLVSTWILEQKVRSRALIFVIKYYYFLVYFIFYRNLFARLNSFDQFALIQLLSSFWVCIWYPFSMTRRFHALLSYFSLDPRSYEEHVESMGLAFYLRNLAQNTTMIAFLGWVSILHFGPNQHMYPFFAFADKRDPYNYQLTMLGSSAIWASELLSSFVARQICLYSLDVDVTNLGLDEMRSYPELVTSVMWTSIHVLMDMLLFLIKLDFK
ncbi:hypothetical protein CBS101457_003889 [Exobasidium rhododendri]|nr:hypothetical protein CBS101457_003889 [Exobasidium rhododendri]